MSLIKSLVSTAVVAMLSNTVAQAATVQDAQVLKAGIYRAKSMVDNALRAAGSNGSTGGGGSFPTNPGVPSGGGHGGFYVEPDLTSLPELYDSGDVNESDALALPVFTQASGSLFDAGHFVDVSTIDLLGGNIQQGNFEFAMACSRMGISRSQIARANLAALQPPTGLLAPFSADLLQVVTELNALRFSANCP